jgi:hypothetical protein
MSFNPKDHMIDLKGKEYLPVAYRIVWFREDHPNGAIRSECVSQTPPLFRATVLDEDGRFLSDGHASATLPQGGRAVWSGREFEKAETAAIGRALAHAGYGTQFDAEDEGDYLADSPVEHKPSAGMKTEDPRPANGKPVYDSKAAMDALAKHYEGRWTRDEVRKALGKLDPAGMDTAQVVEAFKAKVADTDTKRMAEELGGELAAPKE